MENLTTAQLQNHMKHYNTVIRNCKKIKRILEKSGLWEDILESCIYIINNYTLEDEIETGLWEYCSKNNISKLSGYDHVNCPSKITSFNKRQLQKVKEALEEKREYRDYTYGNFDFSISTEAGGKRAWYSREYKGCGNGYYYLLLDYNTALFYEKD